QAVNALVAHDVEEPLEAIAALDRIAFYPQAHFHGTNTTLLKNSFRPRTRANTSAPWESGGVWLTSRATSMREPRWERTVVQSFLPSGTTLEFQVPRMVSSLLRIEEKSFSPISKLPRMLPRNTTSPNRAPHWTACRNVRGRPMASTTLSAPAPPVSCLIRATGSPARESTGENPISAARASLRSSMSTTNTRLQPRRRIHCAAMFPIGPPPNTAPKSPCLM